MALPYAVQAVLDCYPYLHPDSIRQRLSYSTFVSISKRYMYFEVPKAACTTMKNLVNYTEHAPPIKCFRGNIRETRRDMFIHDRRNVVLPSLIDLDNNTQKRVLESPDFLRMTVVRNPYTRLIAAWKNKILTYEPGCECVFLEIKGHLPQIGERCRISLEEFVDYLAQKCDLRQCDPHWRLQVDHTFFHAMHFSFVGRMEKMADVLDRFQGHLGLAQPLPEGRANVSGHMNQMGLGEDLGARIYELYRRDFEALDYERQFMLPGEAKPKCGVPEDQYIDEVFERNVVIIRLYEERAELRHELERLERLHILAIAHACLALVRRVRMGLAGCRRFLARFSLSGKARPSRPAVTSGRSASTLSDSNGHT